MTRRPALLARQALTDTTGKRDFRTEADDDADFARLLTVKNNRRELGYVNMRDSEVPRDAYCGTATGYRWHIAHGATPCRQCRLAYAASVEMRAR